MPSCPAKRTRFALALAATLLLGACPDEQAAPLPEEDPVEAGWKKARALMDANPELIAHMATLEAGLKELETSANGLDAVTEPLKWLSALRERELDLLATTVKVWDELKKVVAPLEKVDAALDEARGLATKADALAKAVDEARVHARALGPAWEAAKPKADAATLRTLRDHAKGLVERLETLEGLSKALAEAADEVRTPFTLAREALKAVDVPVPGVGDTAREAGDKLGAVVDALPGADLLKALEGLADDVDTLKRLALISLPE